MAAPLGHERQITFFNIQGHDHDGKNSTPVTLLPGSVQLYHLNDALVDYLRGIGSGGGASTTGDDDVVPVPDVVFQTPPIAVGGSYTGSIPWVGLSFVRFTRILMSQDTECVLTFYHKSTFADEDREFRAYRCANKFLWEGTWAHFDEDDTKMLHYKIENTGNQSATFQVTLKSGTMAANAYALFVDSISVNGGTAITGPINFIDGNGISFSYDGQNITANASAPETLLIAKWTLNPKKPTGFSSSATITNVGYLSTGRDDQLAQFGSGLQWIMADLGVIVNLGAVNVCQRVDDGRVFNGVKIEISADAGTWYEIKASGSVWAVPEGITANIPNGYLARYIRVWCNGSTVDSNNYISKITPLVLSNEG